RPGSALCRSNTRAGQGQARQYEQTRRSLSAQLFTAGALAVIRYVKIHGTQHRPWVSALLARRPTKVAAIALANAARTERVGNASIDKMPLSTPRARGLRARNFLAGVQLAVSGDLFFGMRGWRLPHARHAKQHVTI